MEFPSIVHLNIVRPLFLFVISSCAHVVSVAVF